MMSLSLGLRARALLAAAALLLAAAAFAVFPANSRSVPGSPAPSEWVSPTGTDSGACTKSAPCATINYAISQATPGETIHVEKGTYNQTVNVNKAVKIVGAGASETTLSGAGLDPSDQGYYGVVYVGNAGGDVTVSDMTITNPYPYNYTGGEPMAVALHDANSGDLINIVNDNITEGKADTSASTDYPIGIDTFVNAATTTISGDTISGFFQGALLEDNGPATVTDNTFTKLISGTDNSTTPATVYPAEGLFFLADEGGNYTGQDAKNNTFTGYSGYGIAESAGYTGGYVTPGCVANGSITTALANNTFALTGGSQADGISLEANGTGNNLSGSVNDNSGHVTSPSNAIEIQATAVPATPNTTSCAPYGTSNGGAGTLDVTEANDSITVKSASSHAKAQQRSSATAKRIGGLHAPRHLRHHA